MLPAHLHRYFNNRFSIKAAEPVGGGCINDCYKLVTDQGPYFIKLNNASAYPHMFAAEKSGLELLARAGSVKVPGVIDTGVVEDTAFLLLEFIETGRATQNTMFTFGQNLAKLHRNSNVTFGLDYDNYIGSLPQQNEQKSTWADFFVEMRLLPQLKMAGNRLSGLIPDFERLFAKMHSLFPIEKAALLHGDLWSGNFVINNFSEACLVDPAVYYGHREMDIAMSKLFGGFDNDFYSGYNETFPLANGWQERVYLCNLYPLLVHVNLFGGSYVEQVKSCLRRFV